MTRTLLPTLFTAALLGAAAACPVKAGYVANGQFRNTTGLTPLCSPALKRVAASVKPGEYGEFYRAPLDLRGGLAVGRLTHLFSDHGWQRLAMTAPAKGKAFAYQKGGKQTVITVREEDDFALIFVLGDK